MSTLAKQSRLGCLASRRQEFDTLINWESRSTRLDEGPLRTPVAVP